MYGKDGCQITTGTAKEIQKEISRVDMFADVARMSFEKAQAEGLVAYIGKETVDVYSGCFRTGIMRNGNEKGIYLLFILR